jgi:hypothetical protein
VSLTASAVGKVWATSGSKTTMLFADVARSKYSPRTPTPRSLWLYSARSSTLLALATFFVLTTFLPRSHPRAHYTGHRFAEIAMSDEEKPRTGRVADCNEALAE